jgi:translation initiation factor 4G
LYEKYDNANFRARILQCLGWSSRLTVSTEDVLKKIAAPLAQTQDGRAEEIEEGEINEDQDTQPPNQDGREKVRESLRIDTNAPAIGRRRHPGPLDLEEAKKSNVAAPQSALATARIISDIHSVPYPEGVHSPNPALNQNAKEGKFRYALLYSGSLSFLNMTGLQI